MHRHRHLATGLAVLLTATVSIGARPADAALTARIKARRSISCWASTSGPSHVGSNVVASVTWQCTPGIQQQMTPYISLTAPDGTRYGSAGATCYTTTSCPANVNAPYSSGTWSARSDYVFVVDYNGNGMYFFGPLYSASL